MTAANDSRAVIKAMHLRSMYHRYGTVPLEKHLSLAGCVADLVPEFSTVFKDSAYRYGDIFDAMFYSNLVHPPTVLLRRQHVCTAGGLDFTYAWSYEDQEFLWRVSQFGPGALINAPRMLYRVEESVNSPSCAKLIGAFA